jgi:hypothetical protein
MGWDKHLKPTVQGKFDQEGNDLGSKLIADGLLSNPMGMLGQMLNGYQRPGSIDVFKGTSSELLDHLQKGDYGAVDPNLAKVLLEHQIVEDLSKNPAAVAVVAQRFGQPLKPPAANGLDINNKKACEDFLATNLSPELADMSDKDFLRWAKDPVRMCQEIDIVDKIGSNPAKILALALKMNDPPPHSQDPAVLKKWVWDHVNNPLGDMDKSRLNEWSTFANNPFYLAPPSF